MNTLYHGKNLRPYQDYLVTCITKWYHDASKDYNVTGHFIAAIVDPVDVDCMIIIWSETDHTGEPKIKTQAVWTWWDYTPEQVYNIWMEG